jgi:hypothetical protein
MAIACVTTQPKVSAIMRGIAHVEELDFFERIADGLAMPDHARVALGLAPKASPVTASTPAISAPSGRDLVIPSRDTPLRLDASMVPVCSPVRILGIWRRARTPCDGEPLSPLPRHRCSA